MTNNTNDLFSPDEIAQLRAGQTVSKSSKNPETRSTPKKSSDGVNIIQGDAHSLAAGGWGSAPRVVGIGSNTPVTGAQIRDADGTPLGRQKVVTPNLSRHNQSAAERQLKFLEEEQERKQLKAAQSNEALQTQLEAQNRIIRRIEKELRNLKKSVGDND